jgi:hypothetical protein
MEEIKLDLKNAKIRAIEDGSTKDENSDQRERRPERNIERRSRISRNPNEDEDEDRGAPKRGRRDDPPDPDGGNSNEGTYDDTEKEFTNSVRRNIEIWKNEEVIIKRCNKNICPDSDTIKEASSKIYEFLKRIVRDNQRSVKDEFISIRREVNTWTRKIFTYIDEDADLAEDKLGIEDTLVNIGHFPHPIKEICNMRGCEQICKNQTEMETLTIMHMELTEVKHVI